MGLAASRQEAFWESCGFGHLERAKHFLEEGEIDVNWVSYVNDSCPIHTASQGKPEIVDLLIANNCDVNTKDGRGNLAIHHAALKGHADIVEKLIEAGSEVNTQEKNGWTALHNAAYWCHPDVINILLKYHCDVRVKNKDERTALHECARSQNSDDYGLGKVAKLLIDGGSDVNAKSSDSEWGEADLTPLMYAAYHNHPDVAVALLDANCDVDAIDSTYWTALHWAAERGHEELVYLLVEANADPRKRDLKGQTALDRASTDNIKEVLTTMTRLHKELQVVNTPIIQPVTSLRKPVIPYVAKCDPKFKSQSLLPTTWTTSSRNDVRNLINEKKSRLAAQTSQTYRNELARRTGTNIITDDNLRDDPINSSKTVSLNEEGPLCISKIDTSNESGPINNSKIDSSSETDGGVNLDSESDMGPEIIQFQDEVVDSLCNELIQTTMPDGEVGSVTKEKQELSEASPEKNSDEKVD